MVKHLDFSQMRMVIDNEQGKKEVVNILLGQLQYPSLNEINYVAFGEVTEEYHDELYSFIEFQGWKREFFSEFETRTYFRILPDGRSKEEQKVLPEYIRHQIHHPENCLNEHFTFEELKESIEQMRHFV